MPESDGIEVGDHVTIPVRGGVHWVVKKIECRIEPFGVVLISGLTGRLRRETLSNLHIFKKGA